MIDAVVFDLDGVLVDSEVVWERVRRRYVAERGGRWPEDAQRRLMGMSTSEWAAYLAADFALTVPAGTIAEQVVALVAAEYAAHLPLIPGAVEAVRAMAGRWPVAIASSSPASLIEVVLAGADLEREITAWVSSEQLARGKPAPDVYLDAARRLGVDPARCVAVEDSSNGLRSAAAAGMRVIAVPRPEYRPDPGALGLAVRVLDDIADLTVELVAALPDGPGGEQPGGEHTAPRVRP